MNNLNGTAVKEVEMSRVLGLHNSIDSLSDRVNALKMRLECISILKPCNIPTKQDNATLPSRLQEIATATEKVKNILENVDNILNDLEV